MEVGAGLVETRLASVARAVKVRRGEVSAGLQERLIEAVPEFRGDALVVELLLSAVESNVTTLLHVLEHGIDPGSVEPPPAAREYARPAWDFGARGGPRVPGGPRRIRERVSGRGGVPGRRARSPGRGDAPAARRELPV